MPPVDFQLLRVDEFVRKQVKVSAFRHILPDKFVGVLFALETGLVYEVYAQVFAPDVLASAGLSGADRSPDRG